MEPNKKSKLIKIIAIFCAILFIIYLYKHHHSQNNLITVPTPVVVTQKAVLKKMTEYVTQTGTVVAFNSVDLVARVEGYLDAVEFTDGTFVKKDQPLFIIEPEPYKEKLIVAESTVAADKAMYEYAKAEHARQQQMYKDNATSLNNVQKWLAKQEEAQANVQGAIANARIAEINYSYTHVNAPFDGRIGRHLVDPGNLVGNGKATDLATIEQISPIYVYFNLNELDLLKLREAARAQGLGAAQIYQVPVFVARQTDTGFPFQGILNFVNTGLNASTGTMELRAVLPNKDYALLPGLFVQVRIPITKPAPQLTIPDTAIQYDQIGAYVLIMNQNNEVVLKRVKTGSVEQGMRAITQGINAQDEVIVDGLQNATPGGQVTRKKIKDQSE